jgi:hypothetical protein
MANKCKHCQQTVNKFGNCLNPEEGYGDCWNCRHCNHDLTGEGNCPNFGCVAHYNPYDEVFDHAIEKKSHYELEQMHPDDFGYDNQNDEDNYHMIQVCDGCGLKDNVENVISRTKWHEPEHGSYAEMRNLNGTTIYNHVENHLCNDCWNSLDYCQDCGEKLNQNDVNEYVCENYKHCPSSSTCQECQAPHAPDRHYCINPECDQYYNPYDDVYKDKK